MKESTILLTSACVLLLSGIFVVHSTVEYSATSSQPIVAAAPLGILCDHIVDVGETFTVNFTVANVESSRRMYTWEIYVRFDPKILNVSVRSLVWLPSDHVFANKKIVEVEAVLGNGTLDYGASLTGDQQGISGGGTLCQANFTAIAKGVSDLEFDDHGTFILDESNLDIEPITRTGSFIDAGPTLSWIYRDWGKGGTFATVVTEPSFQTCSFNYSKDAYTLEFTVKLDGASHCSIAVPHLRDRKGRTVWDGPFEVLLDGNMVNHTVSFNATHTLLDFSCVNYTGIHSVAITEGVIDFAEMVPVGDLDNNGIVNIVDIAIVAIHFGEKR